MIPDNLQVDEKIKTQLQPMGLHGSCANLKRRPQVLLRPLKPHNTFNLVDAWREVNPSVRDYTFFSAPHATYSGIDHIFVSSALIPSLGKASIRAVAWSDHSLVSVSPSSLFCPPRQPQWRLNESSLSDECWCEDIRISLRQYFSGQLNR